MNETLHKALLFATAAHGTQVRRYTKEPYIVHPIDVMWTLQRHVKYVSEAMLIAALLHDVLEDTPCEPDQIKDLFGEYVLKLVVELTDVYTKEAYPHLNREQRKLLEVQRLAGISTEAQTIKYADTISNARTISLHDKDFWQAFKREKARLLVDMNKGDEGLYKLAHEMLEF